MLLDSFSNQCLVTLFFVFFSWILWKIYSYKRNLPPGPFGLPFLGYAPFLGKWPHVKLTKLKDKFGGIYSLRLFNNLVVVITSHKILKEAFIKQSDVFSSRPKHFHGLPKLKATLGIVGNEGEKWSEFRRFSLFTLRDFGFGKSSLEPEIMEEIDCFLQKLNNFDGKAIFVDEMIRMSVANAICVIIRGQRFHYDDKQFEQLLILSKTYLSKLGINNFEEIWPFKYLKYFSCTENAEKFGMDLYKYFENTVENFNFGDQPSFIESWLIESQSKKCKYISKQQLPRVLMDLFIAGSDTTSTSLHWSLLYMVKYPDVQRKVQEEIDRVIGRQRSPSMSDEKFMPYTEATIVEISRIVTIACLSLPHSTNKDTTLCGYFIPKDTTVVANLWAIHHDPETFPDPFDFKPERFLTDDNTVKRIEEFIPFSIGKRQCMGESMAKMQMFLFFTSLLQKFSFTKGDDEEINLETRYGAVLEPLKHKICPKIR